MEVDGFTVDASDCSREILLVSDPPAGSHVADYIAWGEREGYDQGSTCAARATDSRGWFDLTGHKRGTLFWPMASQYKHAIPRNDNDLICNHNLFDVDAKDGDADVLAGVLNSSFAVLSKHLYGRPVGNEGNLKTEIVDVKMMLIPDPRAGKAADRKRVATAFQKLKQRPAMSFLSERRMKRMTLTAKGKQDQLRDLSNATELDQPDRRRLDVAVFRLMGATKDEAETLTDQLHAYLREFYEGVRRKEEQAAENKKRAKGKGPSIGDIAKQVYEELKDTHPAYLKRYDPDFVDRSVEMEAYIAPNEGEPIPIAGELYEKHGVRFVDGKRIIEELETSHTEQDKLLVSVVRSGIRGAIRIPYEEADCRRLRHRWDKHVAEREQKIDELIAGRSADPDTQKRIRAALQPKLPSGS